MAQLPALKYSHYQKFISFQFFFYTLSSVLGRVQFTLIFRLQQEHLEILELILNFKCPEQAKVAEHCETRM